MLWNTLTTLSNASGIVFAFIYIHTDYTIGVLALLSAASSAAFHCLEQNELGHDLTGLVPPIRTWLDNAEHGVYAVTVLILWLDRLFAVALAVEVFKSVQRMGFLKPVYRAIQKRNSGELRHLDKSIKDLLIRTFIALLFCAASEIVPTPFLYSFLHSIWHLLIFDNLWKIKNTRV
jgi:hypothetical protein